MMNYQELEEAFRKMTYDAENMYALNIMDVLDQVPGHLIPLPAGLAAILSLVKVSLNECVLIDPNQRTQLSAKMGKLIGD